MRTLRFVIEDLAFALLGAVAALLPPRGVVAVGAGLGRLGFALDRRRRRTTLANLRSAFGSSAPEPEIRRVARDCWRHFGRIAVEALAFPRLSAADAGTRVRYRGLEHVRAAYAKGKGVLVFSGHFGNWELLSRALVDYLPSAVCRGRGGDHARQMPGAFWAWQAQDDVVMGTQ